MIKDMLDVQVDFPNVPILSYQKHALFLDIDGTLLDIAKEPDGVIIPDDLSQILSHLYQKFSGALALISGRSLKKIEDLLHPLCPIAGLHGGEIKFGKDVREDFYPSAAFLKAKDFIIKESKKNTMLTYEDKGSIIALHYRLPLTEQDYEKTELSLKKEAEKIMHAALKGCQETYLLQKGKKVIELKPQAFNKATALQYFMQFLPFKNRIPVAVGDDKTDEAMFCAAHLFHGLAIQISPNFIDQKEICFETKADFYINSPKELRAWLSTF